MRRLLSFLVAALLVLAAPAAALAAQFVGDAVSYSVPDPVGAPRTVVFIVSSAWTGGTSSGSTFQIDFGDGQLQPIQVGGAKGAMLEYSSGATVAFEEAKVNHTYLLNGTYTVTISGPTRASNLLNGPLTVHSTKLTVHLGGGNTGAPVGSFFGETQLQAGGTRTLQILLSEPDLDATSCRFATPAESGLSLPSIGGKVPTILGSAGSCNVTWDLTAALDKQRAALPIVLESTHGGVTSSQSMEIVVEMTTGTRPTCVGAAQVVVPVGQVFTQPVTGTSSGPQLTATLINFPSGATLSPGGNGATPFPNTVSWTPQLSDAGSIKAMIANYRVATGLVAHCPLIVTVPTCSNFGASCSVGVGACKGTGVNVCSGTSTLCTAVAGSPTTESCNNVDDDCDGVVDDGNPGGGVACTSAFPSVCGPGTTACTGGSVQCVPTIAPGSQTEVCNGLDDDCDGQTDEGNLGTGAACSSGLPGACSAGTMGCVAGAQACVATITPGSQTEVCNGLDDDCDGQTDEGFGVGSACSSGGVGACSTTGTLVCNGVSATCNAPVVQPSAEVCNGVDDDCDGQTDEGNPGGGGTCSTGLPGLCNTGLLACSGGALLCIGLKQPGQLVETCNGSDDDCDGQTDEGFGVGVACQSGGIGACNVAGVTVCAPGGGVQCGAVQGQPKTEVCNGLDDDCDGQTDEGNPGGGVPCVSALPGLCSAGTTACSGGALACTPNVAPGQVTEVCNGVDDDCDGQVDEGFGLGAACSSGLGACTASGVVVCAGNGAATCSATPGQPTPEVCNGVDDDCDGVVDDGNPGGGQICATGLFGACAVGQRTCIAGGLACVPPQQPGQVAEVCNGVDDDCDGQTDEGFSLGVACGAGQGACAAQGVVVCNGQGGTTCSAVPAAPTTETCNGVDDDCDGQTDEGNPGGGVLCSTGLLGACAQGVTFCPGGALACTPLHQPGQQVETCNGVDDDCDGQVDEGFGVGGACSAGIGECKVSGVLACAGGQVACNAVPAQPQAEICGNGLDDDCDGTADDGCADTDGDGLFNAVEVAAGTDPLDADTDDDGVLDGAEPSWEVDSDGDGLINALDPDSDDDGLLDGTELGLPCSDPDTALAAGHCVADADQGATKTDPLAWDTDGGGASDGSEDVDHDGATSAGETNPIAGHGGDDAGVLDTDGDGLGDLAEAQLGTSKTDADTDDDGVLDGAEPNPTLDSDGDGLPNALDPDSDQDGLFDGTELGLPCSDAATDPAAGACIADADQGATRTSPLLGDTDHGGASDASEDPNRNGKVDAGEKNPLDASDDAQVADGDGDGLGDALELALGGDPADADSDDDGLLDGLEPNPTLDVDGDGLPDVLDPDSDGDGLFDGTESGKGCGNPATDVAAGHCIPDASAATHTSPLLADTDGGGADDGMEDLDGDGKVDVGETDPLDPSDDAAAPGCDADLDCGGVKSGRVCDATGACVDGCRGQGGNGCPTGEVCSSQDATVGTCDAAPPECDTDGDCGDATSGRICEAGKCKDGCRGKEGNGCPEGLECTSTGAWAGVCVVAGGCDADAACGAADSGMVCDDATHACVEGCRGADGNGCPEGLECTSSDATVGTCQAPEPVPPTPPATKAPTEEGGCGVAAGRDEQAPALALLVAALACSVLRARRRPRPRAPR